MNTALRDQLIRLGFRESCTKHGHRSQGAAQAQLRSLLARQERQPDRKSPDDLKVYRCKRCGLWHVGHGTFLVTNRDAEARHAS